MDMLQEYQYRVEHQHSDGTWSGLAEDPSHHDAAAHDPERGWLARTFRCTSCGEVMRVMSRARPGEKPAPDAE